MTMHTVFSEPAFADARLMLMKSETGASIVAQLEKLSTKTHVMAASEHRELYGEYRAAPNLYEAHVPPGGDPSEVALTIGHEGVHRIRRKEILLSVITRPLYAIPDALVGAASAVRQRSSPFSGALQQVDHRSMREELIAFQTEGKISQELGLPAGGTIARNADGSLTSEHELLHRLKPLYRSNIWVGRGIAAAVPAGGGYYAWKALPA